MAIDREDTLKKAETLLRAVRLSPHDREARLVRARASVLSGDFAGARAFLDRETAGDDPTLQMALLEMDLRSGEVDEARELLRTLLARGAEPRDWVTELAWAMAASNPDAAFVIIDALVNAAGAAGSFGGAAALLQEFAARVPNQIPALLKLVEVCVDGGLEVTMYEAQAQLADAYLCVGQAAEARVIAEDLVAREPWERAHIERFRRALMILKVPDPDSLIAIRLSGEVPFIARDVFATQAAAAVPKPLAPPPPVAEPTVRTVPQPEPFDESPPAEPAEPRLETAPASSIGPLETASRATRFRFEAASRLGRLFQDRGDTPRAIEWLERAAEAPAPSEEDSRALLYDLGSMVEESGDTARALTVFLELQSEAGDYRDVAERVERLARVEAGG